MAVRFYIQFLRAKEHTSPDFFKTRAYSVPTISGQEQADFFKFLIKLRTSYAEYQHRVLHDALNLQYGKNNSYKKIKRTDSAQS